jgi:hypothetical protein
VDPSSQVSEENSRYKPLSAQISADSSGSFTPSKRSFELLLLAKVSTILYPAFFSYTRA